MPEIGLNGLLLDKAYSGTAVYTRNLVPLLPGAAPDLDFCLFVRRAAIQLKRVAVQRLSTPLGRLDRGTGVGARLDKLTWEEISLPVASAVRRQALLHSLYFAAPVVAGCPLVVTVHDLIPLVVPGYHRSRQSVLYSDLMARAVKRAGAIITVSRHSRSDIIRVLGVSEDRVHVTYEAADERFTPVGQPGEREELYQRYPLPERFFLYTGGAERRKGLETLVRAWAETARVMREQDIKLVIVAGFPPPDRLYPDIPGLVRELGLDRDIVLIGAVDEDSQPALYRAALAFCFPSSYEGFGLTPLEAMASGIPVIASDATSIPEVVGDAALLVKPGDVPAWADAMISLAGSRTDRTRLARLGLEQARQFSWQRTAEETVGVYRQVLSR